MTAEQNIINKNIGKTVKKIRLGYKTTQKDLASDSKVSRKTIVETDGFQPRFNQQRRV